MAGGLFNRKKIWNFEEVLKAVDVNAEFDNIITHFSPEFMASFSQTISQMQLQLDPGGVGTESPAASTAEEIEQLRFVLSRIIGKTFWYQSPAISLQETNDLINQIAGLPPNRIVSGAEISASDEMPAYLIPAGSSNSVTIKATPTPLVVRIDGTQYSLTSDIVVSGLVMAPATSNTALVNDSTLVGDVFSTVKGEFGSSLIIDTAGTAISALVGSYAAFKIVDGGNTEYFTAFVKSSTELVNLRRGFFLDSALLPIPRITINDNDVITLMKLTYIFLHSDLTAEAVYTNPSYKSTQPSSPAVGDYWFNVTTKVWNRFTGSSWVAANATLVGICITDTANTVAARAEDFYANVTKDISMELDYVDNTEVHGTQQGSEINVMGRIFSFGQDDLIWDITTDLESGFTEQASTMYFLYITEQGGKKMSPVYPQLRQDFLGSYYHPYKQWRCVGWAYNNSGSNIESFSSVDASKSGTIHVDTANGYGSTGIVTRRWTNVKLGSADFIYTDSAVDGSSFRCVWPGAYSINFTDNFSASSGINITKNNVSTTQDSSTYLASQGTAAANVDGNASVTADLKIGDLILTQTGSIPSGANPGASSANFKRVT